MQTDLLTIPEAAEALGVSYWKLYKRVQKGVLASTWRGHYRLIQLDDARAALDIDRRRIRA